MPDAGFCFRAYADERWGRWGSWGWRANCITPYVGRTPISVRGTVGGWHEPSWDNSPWGSRARSNRPCTPR